MRGLKTSVGRVASVTSQDRVLADENEDYLFVRKVQ